MSRTRVTCQGCKNRSTQNQLKGSKGFCTQCGHDILKDRWHRFVGGDLQSLNFEPATIDRIFDVARGADLHPTDLIKLAVTSRLFTWDANPDKLKQDQMLHKLVRE